MLGGVAALALVGGPRGVVDVYVRPVQAELGGWAGLVLGAVGWDHSTDIPVYEIEIEPRVFEAAELFNRVDDSSSRASSERWWFPARFRVAGVGYDVDIQLSRPSSPPEPLRARSWRLRFQDKEGYRGVRELKISPANDLRDAQDLVVRDAAQGNGLLAPPAGFAALRINGAAIGDVFWSEGNSHAMLERLGFPKGEILEPASPVVTIPSGLAGSSRYPVVLARYQASIGKRGASAAGVAEDKLESLLELVRYGDDDEFEARVSELLDVEKFLRWNALTWVFAEPQSEDLAGLSWYFDPVTGLLEPVVQGFGEPRAPGFAPPEVSAAPNGYGEGGLSGRGRLTSRLLAIPAFNEHRNELLWESVGHRGGELLVRSDEKLGSELTRLARSRGMLAEPVELRRFAEFRRARRLGLSERIRSLESAVTASRIAAHATRELRDDTAALTLELRPTGLAAILVTELRIELGAPPLPGQGPAIVRLIAPDGETVASKRIVPEIVGSSVSLRTEGVAVAARMHDGNRDAEVWRLEVDLPFVSSATWGEAASLAGIDIDYRNQMTGEDLPPTRFLYSSERAPARSIEDSAPAPGIAGEIIAASGLPFQELGDQLVLPAGDYSLLETLVIPSTHRIVLEPGVTLRMGPAVSLISFRAMRAEGTAARPIEIRALDPAQPWGTFGVARAGEVSRLSYVRVSGGSKAEIEGIRFGGELSFNATEVVLTDSEIRGARGADGLSLKRSGFEVVRTAFNENDSDGLDANWSEGLIRDSVFFNNGDDGLDLSDSQVSIDDSSFQWMHDKSITAGARSRVVVISTHFSDSRVAITSKDGSDVDVRDSEFRRNRVGFSLYHDRPTFGGGSGTVIGGLFAQNERDVSVEPGSHLELIRVQREPVSPREPLADVVALEAPITPMP